MLEFNATNTGKRIVINSASFKEVLQLKKALLSELSKHPIGLKVLNSNASFLEKELDFTNCIDFLKNVLIGADTTQEVETAIFECLKHCTYDTTNRIDEGLFDRIPEARADYYEILIKCVEENLKPFIKSLASLWKTLIPKLGESQALNTALAMMKQ